MPRTSTFESLVDTAMFTPLQLQPRSLFQFAMTGWTHWLREHWIPFPRLIRDHGLGVVIAALDLRYLRAFRCFDSEALVATVTLRAEARGSVLLQTLALRPVDGDEAIACVDAVLRPVIIDDSIVLSATPSSLDADMLAGFAPDEILAPGDRPRLRATVSALESGSPPIAAATRTFVLHRHLCEAADQWSGIALTDVTTESRERMASEPGAHTPELSEALVQPMHRVALEFRRPAFFLDDISSDCRAYERTGGLVFVHHLSSALDGQLLATAVEWFAAGAPADPDRLCHHGQHEE